MTKNPIILGAVKRYRLKPFLKSHKKEESVTTEKKREIDRIERKNQIS